MWRKRLHEPSELWWILCSVNKCASLRGSCHKLTLASGVVTLEGQVKLWKAESAQTYGKELWLGPAAWVCLPAPHPACLWPWVHYSIPSSLDFSIRNLEAVVCLPPKFMTRVTGQSWGRHLGLCPAQREKHRHRCHFTGGAVRPAR